MTKKSAESGFTLVEVMLVIVLVAVMSTLAASRFGLIENVRQKSSIQKFINTWEFVAGQARARGQSYRLVIDLGLSSYYVRREVPLETARPKNVDYLKNFRTKSEQERMAREEEDKLESVENEYKEEDIREGDSLENIYYRVVFRDPEGAYRLGVPLEFPSLAQPIKLSESVHIRDVVVRGEEYDDGTAPIRFTSTGANEFAVVHFSVGENIMTAVMNPATGKVQLQNGDIKFEWSAAKK